MGLLAQIPASAKWPRDALKRNDGLNDRLSPVKVCVP